MPSGALLVIKTGYASHYLEISHSFAILGTHVELAFRTKKLPWYTIFYLI